MININKRIFFLNALFFNETFNNIFKIDLIQSYFVNKFKNEKRNFVHVVILNNNV